ncbi:paraslipin [Porticoccaceae bacterium]|nr:paraslipin [Porticoccaceae bacterium]
MEGTFVVVAILILVIITLFKGIRLVPQGSKWVVQRLGKFHKSLSPGLNLIIPYIDDVSFKATTKDIVLDIPSQEVITLDNVVIIANAVAYINIISPERAVYGVEDYELAIRTLVQTSLRSIVGEMALDDALSSRDQIKAKLKDSISEDIADWGITLKTVEIQDINPSGTMQQALVEYLIAAAYQAALNYMSLLVAGALIRLYSPQHSSGTGPALGGIAIAHYCTQHGTNHGALGRPFYSAVTHINIGGIVFTVRQIHLVLVGVYTQGIYNYFLWRAIAIAVGTAGKSDCECN